MSGNRGQGAVRDQGTGIGRQMSGVGGLSGVRGMGIKSYRDLEVWKKAMELVTQCYEMTENFPKKEIFGLASQLQRAAVSIPANISEGHARQHTKEFIQYISIAYGSLAELETHIEIAKRLGYITADTAVELNDKTSAIGRMLNGLRKSLRERETGR